MQGWTVASAPPVDSLDSSGRITAWISHPATWHAAFWTFSILNELVIVIVEQRALSLALLGAIVGLYAALALPGYINILVLIPRLARRRHYVRYALALLTVCMAVALVFTALRPGSLSLGGSLLRSSVRMTFTSLLFTGLVTALDLGARHVRAERQRALQEREHAERRLEHLKTQLNPHFLFNTLNSLYALAIERSGELPELILKHAALLRYVLYGADSPNVPLAREIEFLADYFELERLRLDESTDVRFEVSGVIAEQTIAPLLLLPLVENCFKHLGSVRGKAAFIHVSLTVRDGGAVELQLVNSRSPEPGEIAGAGGIGLRNTRERLVLLYPGRHSLVVRETLETFSVALTLRV